MDARLTSSMRRKFRTSSKSLPPSGMMTNYAKSENISLAMLWSRQGTYQIPSALGCCIAWANVSVYRLRNH